MFRTNKWMVQTEVEPNVFIMNIREETREYPDEPLTPAPFWNDATYNSHEHVEVQYRGETIKIDKSIATLMQKIWDCGIRTLFCCQGYHSVGYETTAYIMFEGGLDADTFVAAVCTGAGADSFLAYCVNVEDETDPNKWEWSPAFYKGRVRWTVRIPRHHLQDLEDSLGTL